MGRNYGGASEGGLRRRLMLLVAIFACTFIFVAIQRGDWSPPRDWQDGHGPSVAQVNDAPRAVWRWVSSVRVYDHGHAFLVELRMRASDLGSAVHVVLAPYVPSLSGDPH
jgi:hypothetical protein